VAVVWCGLCIWLLVVAVVYIDMVLAMSAVRCGVDCVWLLVVAVVWCGLCIWLLVVAVVLQCAYVLLHYNVGLFGWFGV